MYRDPFDILQLDKNTCTQFDVENAYRSLKSMYQSQRFEEGEIGTNAARMLDELEIAYKDAIVELSESYTINNGGSVFDRVEEYIKVGNLVKAQEELDGISERGGKWHYLQASIFYKKNWMMEARKQLQLAIALEPNNMRYKDTLNKLEDEMRSANPFTNMNGQQQGRTYQEPSRGNRSSADDCCDCCSAMICADCLCNCIGGGC